VIQWPVYSPVRVDPEAHGRAPMCAAFGLVTNLAEA
jgi:hypothetical protein